MRVLFVLVAAVLVGFLAAMVSSGPASAARSWKDWVTSGYCPAGTCNSAGGWRTRNISFCKPRPNCRWP
jgi:hypothetical protein